MSEKYLILCIIIVFLLIILGASHFMKKGNKKIVLSTSIILFSLLSFFIYFCYEKINTPIINIKGDEIVNIDVFSEYKDEGYEIIKGNKKINVETINTVDTDKTGVYNVTYSLKYHNKNISKTRKVIVEDKVNPEIKLNGDSEVNIIQGSNYNEPGYTATDNYDKNITDKVKVESNVENKVGKYEITYSVEDSSGNTASIKRIINVIKNNNGVVYLTFDDGPSSSTTKILDILKKENIKATFFVVNYSDYYSDVIKRIVNEGHTIAVHSYTHNYKLIYASEDAYFDDLYKLRDKIKNTTGVESNIIRFPGGSSNTVSMFNKGIMTRLVKLVKEKGFHYFDWNVDSRDAWDARNSTQVYNNVINGLAKNRNNVVLMHDLGSNVKTVEALPKIISTMKNRGYSFDKITMDTPMVVHGLHN